MGNNFRELLSLPLLSAITGADKNEALGKRGRFLTFLRGFKCGENLCPTNDSDEAKLQIVL